MRRTIQILSVGILAVVVTAVAGAQTPTVTPFPASKVVPYFVAARTVTAPGASEGSGVLLNFFKRGSTVVFQVAAAETKSGKLVTADDAKYFYVKIPGQPNVKLTYTAPTKKTPGAPWSWAGSWTIPADYPTGIVGFQVLLKSKSGGYGSFVQVPVVSSQLTVTKA